jgi:hypothetical protein
MCDSPGCLDEANHDPIRRIAVEAGSALDERNPGSVGRSFRIPKGASNATPCPRAVPTAEQLQAARAELANRSADVDLGFAAAQPADVQDFDFLFLALQQDPANLLPESADTVTRLKDLGRTMEDPGGEDPGDADSRQGRLRARLEIARTRGLGGAVVLVLGAAGPRPTTVQMPQII